MSEHEFEYATCNGHDMLYAYDTFCCVDKASRHAIRIVTVTQATRVARRQVCISSKSVECYRAVGAVLCMSHGCCRLLLTPFTLKAKKLYRTISVMLHASKSAIRFSSMECSPRGTIVTPLLAICAGAATMMPQTTHTLDVT